jgi:hypothetical protein
MKRILGTNLGAIEILKWHEDNSDATLKKFHDKSSALSFLRQFMPDHAVMRSFRNLLAEESHCQDISRISDHEVLDQLAWRWSSLHARIAVSPAELLIIASQAIATEPEISSEPIKILEPAIPPKEEPVLPSMLAQAAVFRLAAESGAPLCGI